MGGDGRVRLAVRGMQAAILAVLVAGVVLGNVSVVVNAVAALAVTFLPAALERDRRIALGPHLTLWVAVAVLLHAVGMVGLYERVAWWDHLTHALSATVVATTGYAGARAIDRHSPAITLPPGFLAAFVLLFTMALGVAWEVLEFAARNLAAAFGLTPVLVQYGVADSVLDLLFDFAGAALVTAFGALPLDDVTDAVAARLGRA